MGGVAEKTWEVVKPVAQIAATPYTAGFDFTKAVAKGKGVGGGIGAAFKPAIEGSKTLLGGAMDEISGGGEVPQASASAPTPMSASEKAKMEADAKRKERASLLADTPGRRQTILTDMAGDSSFPYRLY
jgi:hypothetical protein